MSSSFSVYPQRVKRYKTDAEAVHKNWITYNGEINSVLGNLGDYSGYVNVKRRLSELCNSSGQNADSMQRYIRAIEEIIDKYESTERRICDGAAVDEPKWENLTPSEPYIPDGIEVDDSWWDQFKKFCEDKYTSMPEWLRLLLLINPTTSATALLPYIFENDYLKTAYWQAVGGDFEDDSNVLGVFLSVVIGFIPVVGTVADIRDLIADTYNLIDDGPQAEEWIELIFTSIALFPVLGDLLKHGYEAGDFLKGIFKNADSAEYIDDAADAVKHAGDFISDTVDKVKEFKENFNKKTIENIAGPLKDALEKKLPDKFVDAWKKTMGTDISNKGTIGDFLKELIGEEINETTGFPTDLEDLLKEIFTDNNNENMQSAGGGASRSSDAFWGIMRANTGFCTAFA